MHPLVRDAKLSRQLGLRNASSVSGADDFIALLDGEEGIRLRGIVVHDLEGGTG